MQPNALVRAVLYKEAVKLRMSWLMLFLLNALFMGWLFVGIRHLFRQDHPEVVWYRVMHLGQEHYTAIKYVPLCLGLVLACLQFLPEMRDERMRLSLHLPVSSNAVVLTHLFAGLVSFLLICLFDVACLAGITRYYFPVEAVRTMLLTVVPWVLAGMTGYLGTTQALLEPRLKLRVFILGVTAGLVSPMYGRAMPGAFADALWVMALIVPVLLLAALLPAYHFRHRRVDL